MGSNPIGGATPVVRSNIKIARPILIDSLAVITLGIGAFFLRLIIEPLRYFNIDEAFHLFVSTLPDFSSLMKGVAACGPQQYPLDFIVNFFISHWTNDLHILRRVDIFWGCLSVVLTYFLGKSLINRTFGWVWALLLCFSTIHIQYSVTLRHYSLSLFLAILSLYCFAKYMECRNEKYLWLYLGSMLLYETCFPYAILNAVVDCGFTLWLRRSLNKKEIASFLLILIIPSIAIFVKAIQILGQPEPMYFYDQSFWVNWERLQYIFTSFSQDSNIGTSLFLVIFMYGGYSSIKTKSTKPFFTYMLVLFIFTFVTIMVSSIAARYRFSPKHVLVLLPLYLGLISFAFTTFVEKIKTKWRRYEASVSMLMSGVFLFAWCILALHALQKWPTNQVKAKNLVDQSVSNLKGLVKTGDSVVFSNPNLGVTWLHSFDPNLFFKMKWIHLANGYLVFEFPSPFIAETQGSKIEIFTLCSINPSIATIDKKGLTALKMKAAASGNTIWLVHLPINYIPEPNPFEEYGENSVESFPPQGIGRLR